MQRCSMPCHRASALLCSPKRSAPMLPMQGVRAVVTLNEEFEVFISSDQYKARLHLLLTVSEAPQRMVPRH